ncbi:putative PPPDE peptidase domain protein [Gregarina niphandrodes]|uniref:PPPDE peptidase domain protein n=1 Tax=Gregarina niphandrodes TaxID=110365 RepID=A0A023B844_GRENI|nr:putative PPPDE peptidase domain protein [Gregarina niphandrodes]EZG68174.1 putative PPPDE peptidase domain protein [Gregarina niphandrodes]|eukprot:XP_011130068.1 putative PPPDE peptidase domain protein [Gregarina niphandrodes]
MPFPCCCCYPDHPDTRRDNRHRRIRGVYVSSPPLSITDPPVWRRVFDHSLLGDTGEQTYRAIETFRDGSAPDTIYQADTSECRDNSLSPRKAGSLVRLYEQIPSRCATRNGGLENPSSRIGAGASITSEETLPPQTRRWLRKEGDRQLMELLLHKDPEDVFLKVYDITEGRAHKVVKLAAGFDIEGVWHTSILTYGKERFYCDGPMAVDSDVVEKKFAIELKHIFYLGKTSLSEHQIHRIVKSLRHKYTPESYDLIQCNCNHFTQDVLWAMKKKGDRSLVNYELPDFIRDQPKLFMSTARGRALIWLVQNILEKTDNFLNNRFANGLDTIVKKFV